MSTMGEATLHHAVCIYCDTLVELFERETGLVTQMPRVIFT